MCPPNLLYFVFTNFNRKILIKKRKWSNDRQPAGSGSDAGTGRAGCSDPSMGTRTGSTDSPVDPVMDVGSGSDAGLDVSLDSGMKKT